jgi:hypothetical protein
MGLPPTHLRLVLTILGWTRISLLEERFASHSPSRKDTEQDRDLTAKELKPWEDASEHRDLLWIAFKFNDNQRENHWALKPDQITQPGITAICKYADEAVHDSVNQTRAFDRRADRPADS